MRRTGKAILAVLAGVAVWALLWTGGTRFAQATFSEILQPDRPITHTGMLLAFIAYSVVLSLMAGYVTASLARRRPWPAMWTLAVLQLALGIVAEISYWSLMPVWYHLVFLALVVPATLAGGMLRVRQRPLPAPATT